jgi:hypothetical protein
MTELVDLTGILKNATIQMSSSVTEQNLVSCCCRDNQVLLNSDFVVSKSTYVTFLCPSVYLLCALSVVTATRFYTTLCFG